VEFEQGGYFPPDQPLPAISNPAIDVAAPVDAAEIHTHLLSSAELTTVLDALLNDVRNKILQAPNVLVASGQRATFMVNNARPPLAEFTPAFQAAILAASPTATQADVGPTLDLTPEIQSGGQIVLRVHPGTLAASFPTFPTFPVLGLPSTVQTPIVGLRQAQTNVTVPDGGTVLIGGLKTLSGQTETDLPVLKDIPVLNALFRDGTHVQEKDMLMILITPRIVGAP
jgi:type II secretory pathway component GspD/PulD (secretin)